MVFLARKITRAKWEANENFADGEIPADAITSDLRTSGNSLSFWQCGNGTREEVEEAALALAAASKHVDKLEIVWLSNDHLVTDGQQWDDTEGRTPVRRLIRRHIDVSLLDHERLGRIAHRIVASMQESRYRRLTKKRVASLLATAVREGEVELAELEERVQEEVRKSLGESRQ